MAFKFNIRNRRTQRTLVYVIAAVALGYLAVTLLRRWRRRSALASSEYRSSEVSAEICAKRKEVDSKGKRVGKKWFDPAKPTKCYDETACRKKWRGEGIVVNGTCPDPAGGSTKKCTPPQIFNGTNCIDPTPESERYGGQGGALQTVSCKDNGGYIKDIKVRYDNGPNELKNMVVTCADGRQVAKGYRLDSTLYEEKNWADPHGKGWYKVGFVTNFDNLKDDRIRAWGPEYSNMLGSNWREGDKKNFDCNAAAGGPAPGGQRFAINEIDVASGKAIDSVRFRCGLIPA